MEETTKEEAKKTKPIKIKFGKWKLLTVIFAILFVFAIFTKGFSFIGITGMTTISAKDAADKAINFINKNLLQGQTATLVGVEEENNLYKITIMIAGKSYESYVTKDGKLLFTSAIDLEEVPEAPDITGAATAEIPKTKTPKVELFVMSHCPYGTQAEKGIIPAVKLLKDKIDFSIKFVYYAMHGEKELKEQTLQYCIQKEQEDKFLDYLYCFLKDENTEDCLKETKIDQVKLNSCIEKTDKEFKITEQFEDQSTWLNGRFPRFDIHKEENEKYGIGGSPTLIINGIEVSSARDPTSYLKKICSAFTEEPDECSEKLSTQTPSPGFGFSVTGAASAGSCG